MDMQNTLVEVKQSLLSLYMANRLLYDQQLDPHIRASSYLKDYVSILKPEFSMPTHRC